MRPNATYDEKAKRRYWRLLKHGDVQGEYLGDDTRLVGELVRCAVESGVPLERLLRGLEHRENAASAAFQSRTNPHGRVKTRDVQRWYDRDAASDRKQFDLAERRAELAAMRERITTSAWPAWIEYREPGTMRRQRASGENVRRVLVAHLDLSIAATGIDYPASHRKVSELANAGDTGVERATAALVALGIVRPRPAPGRRDALTAKHYRINTTASSLGRILPGRGSASSSDLGQFATHPAWQHGTGLRFDVWAQIVTMDGQATVTAVANALEVSRPTVRRVVARAAAVGLIERCDDHTLRPCSDDHLAALDAVALDTGAAQRSANRLERHEHDRAAHAESIIRRGGRMLRAAIRRGSRMVREAIRSGLLVNRATGEIVTAVSSELLPPLRDLAASIERAHAPPLAAAA